MMVGAFHSWDGMMLSCVRLERHGFQVALTKSADDPISVWSSWDIISYHTARLPDSALSHQK